MEYFETLNTNISLRSAALEKDFTEYRKKLIQLKKMEEKLLKLDEEIYGVRGKIISGYLTKSPRYPVTNYGNIVFYISNGTIICNEYQSQLLGNGCTLREERIVPHELSAKGTIFVSDEVCITLRRLKKKFEDKVKKMVNDERRRFNSIKNNKSEDNKSFLNIGLHDWFDEKGCYRKCYLKLYKDSDFEKFVKAVITDFDFVSYYVTAYTQNRISSKGTNHIENMYDIFTEQMKTLKKIGKMPTDSEFYKELVKWCGYSEDSIFPNVERAKFAIKTIESEVEAAEAILSSTEEYTTLRKQYEFLKNEIRNIERRHNWIN